MVPQERSTALEDQRFRLYEGAGDPMRHYRPIGVVFFLSSAAFTCSACAVPVEANLDDNEANRVFVALDRAGIEVVKEPDPGVEGKWRLSVAREDVAGALSILRDEGLPRRESAGILDSVGKGSSLVPSEAAEHAQLVAGTASELERSLLSLEGIFDARVHLSVPAPPPLSDRAVPPGTASVLLEYRGATPPLSADSVQRLVAGAVAGLLAADVNVVMVSRTAPAHQQGGDLAHVGPISVARTSVQKLHAALAALVALVALLTGATIFLYTRWVAARSAPSDGASTASR
jgi:type III secretion protein J